MRGAQTGNVQRVNRRKRKEGIVLSDKMEKTIVVQTQERVPHPIYGKIVRRFSKFKAHDEKKEAKRGDRVEIEETRPLSKDKRWRLVRILERSQAAQAEGTAT